MLHLAQLVAEAGAAGLGGHVLRRVVHVHVPADEGAVPKVDELGSAEAGPSGASRGSGSEGRRAAGALT